MKFEQAEILELARAIADAIASHLATPASGPELVGPRDVGIPSRTWRVAIRSGRLPGFLIGRQLLARREDVTKWLELADRCVREGIVIREVDEWLASHANQETLARHLEKRAASAAFAGISTR